MMFDSIIDSAISTGKDYIYSSVNNTADKIVDNLINEAGGNAVKGSVYYQQSKQAATQFMQTPFLQGWQWCVEADNAPFDFDIYVKDIDFGAGSIDSDVFQIGAGSIALPTFSSAGEISFTVRDNSDLRVSKWFDGCLSRVKNNDGTLNLPKDYVFNIKIFILNEYGVKTLLSNMSVFALKKGNYSLSRDGINTFMSVPLTFQKFNSVGNKKLNNSNGLSSVAEQLVDNVVNSASDFIDGIF